MKISSCLHSILAWTGLLVNPISVSGKTPGNSRAGGLLHDDNCIAAFQFDKMQSGLAGLENQLFRVSQFMDQPPRELLGLDATQIADQFQVWGEAAYRGRQLYRSIYCRKQFAFPEMTDLSKPLRSKLETLCTVTLPHIHTLQQAKDGTEKFLFELSDGQRIESVFIPEPQRNTLCISTQVGCAMDCQFCLTALLGFSRNLTPGEIVGQILAIIRRNSKEETHKPVDSKPVNVVLMGMGEPLLNLPNVSKALVLMSDPDGMSISPRRITLSTVGIVPKLKELAEAPAIPKIAISLSATTNEIRDQLFPINKKYPIEMLLEACRQFPLPARERFTIEYVMIDGVNDSDEDARRLVGLLSRLRAKVNLLPLNPGQPRAMQPSPPERVERFQKILISKGLAAYIRRPRGQDIFAACGQLSRRIGGL
jgi:23S rRNA (adenine2503-C2)-methyltransferase